MIEFYKLSGEYEHSEELSLENLSHFNGMKIRCTLMSGEVLVGYCKSGELIAGENVELSCDFDYDKGFYNVRKIYWQDIYKVEAILYSGSRWGGKIDFSFNVSTDKIENGKKDDNAGVVIPDFLLKPKTVQLLKDEEIESILNFKSDSVDASGGVRVVDLYHEFAEKLGLYEAEKLLLAITDKSIVLSEIERQRADLESRTSMVSGNVENNPKDLKCPKCGCKYVALYSYSDYLYKTKPHDEPVKQRLSAASSKFDEEYNYCLGCGHKF